MYKKLLLFFFFLFTCFWTGINQSHAEMLDYMSGSTRFSFYFTKNNLSLTGTIITSTGQTSITPGKNLYLKSIDCAFKSYTTSIAPMEFYLLLSPDPSFPSNSSNYIKIDEKIGTGQIIYNSYPINQIATGSNIYYQYINIFDSGSTLNSSKITCSINGTYFTDYINFSQTSSSTGSITINDSNIVNQLSFQNDLLIYTIGFFIMFFAFLLSFSCYSYLSKSYFFNKPAIGKKP